MCGDANLSVAGGLQDVCLIIKVDKRRCLLQLTSYAATLQDSNVSN